MGALSLLRALPVHLYSSGVFRLEGNKLPHAKIIQLLSLLIIVMCELGDTKSIRETFV